MSYKLYNFRADPNLVQEFDKLVVKHGYNRSEAIREGMRLLMEKLENRKEAKEE